MSVTTARALRTLLSESDHETLRECCGERARFDEPLAPYTSWKIGGPADAVVTVENEHELADLFELGLAGQYLALPGLLRRLVGVEFGHHLAGEELEALADVFVSIFTGLVQQYNLIDV